jgi:SAM-dependent methyltransferase
MKEFWNKRYEKPGFAYGKEPNKFLKERLEDVKPGKILLLGEGEGRNAVYSAKLGWNVTAVDFSETGREKALKLASEESVNIEYILSDLKDYIPEPESYDAAGLIFVHLEPSLREYVHKKVISGLKNGGRVVLECYEKENIKLESGGPKDPDLLYSLEDIFTDFQDFDIISLEKKEIKIEEGKYHNGTSLVIRFVGLKV